MPIVTLLAFSSAILAAMMALGAAWRARRAVDRWAFVLAMLALAVERVADGFVLQAGSPAEVLRWQYWRLTALSLLPGSWLLFSLTYARGNAREFISRWRVVLGFAFALPIAMVTLFHGSLVTLPEQGIGETGVFRLGPAGTALYLLLLVAIVLSLVNLERTFRASVGMVRWRIKFMLLGLGILFLLRLYTASQALLFRALDPSLDFLNSGALLIAGVLILRSLFRTGHLNLDVYPSHSVLQGSVTILLIGVYLLVVGVFARIVSYLGGDSSFALKALLVLALLVLLTLFLQSDRVRLRLRQFVSRHFQRPLHDYRTVWRRFTEGTASRVEQADYCRAVVKLVAEIFESLSVTLWVADVRRGELTSAASTSLSDSQAAALQPDEPQITVILEHFRAHPEPVDFEEVSAPWAEVLRRCHPDQFHKGGTRVCAPVLSGGEVLALLLIGDRVGGTQYTVQDLDLLKSIADQVASGLLNVRLSQRLLQSREHEAFQAMATFFVHDLKNAASTLNLMLQNLPEHFDDPEFRQDALRGVGKSVAHINHLISRLGQLRSELKISPVESDLNEIISSAMQSFPSNEEFAVETDFSPLPRFAIDREQFGKVITNLALNAREACAAPGGRFRISTNRTTGWAIVEARDNGAGMPPEFVSRSLFRPFQTTKKSGLGIGMFQSKLIVEAHGGRIAVESKPGHGTTFRVFLPLTPDLR